MDLSQFTSYIQLLSSFLVALTGLTAAMCALVKPIRNWFSRMFRKMQADQKLEQTVVQVADRQSLIKEAMLTLLRNELTQIYRAADSEGYIGDWDRENFLKMYAAYTALGGNSYVHTIYELVVKMPSSPAKKRRTTRKVKK